MDVRSLTDLVEFAPDGPHTGTLFESDHLWSQVVCLERNQQYGPVTDPGSDGLFTVVAGQVVGQVGRRRKRMKQWDSVMVPAGEMVTVTNATGEPAVVLVVAAPPPTPSATSG